jgi:hypothetical protein
MLGKIPAFGLMAIMIKITLKIWHLAFGLPNGETERRGVGLIEPR